MEYIEKEDGIYLYKQEEKLAEVTFEYIEKNKININHTFVDESLRGKGIANELLKHLVTYMENKNLKCIPTCVYAIKWFEKHPEKQSLIEK